MNGYIQIELGGELRALKFNMYAIEIIAAKATGSQAGNLAVFIYAGLCGNEYVRSSGADSVCHESFEEIFEWAEDIYLNKKDVFAKILETYWASKPMQKVKEDGEREEEKKKTEAESVLLGNLSTNTRLDS